MKTIKILYYTIASTYSIDRCLCVTHSDYSILSQQL